LWTVEYVIEKPITKLAFIRNPNDARVKRWHPLSEEFEVIHSIEDSATTAPGEFIIRKDGQEFSKVTLKLTPTYTYLPKDYAPFSPFSNGGILFHSGRFFACAESCLNVDNLWTMTLKVAGNEHIILNGEVLNAKASWQDNNSGRSIYVGKQQPIERTNIIAMIDDGLPEKIQISLTDNLPKMLEYFESNFGKLTNKPMIFASYAKNTTSGSSQGGTFPNQIYTHWDGIDLEAAVKKPYFIDLTRWFFAHEAAHLYQNRLLNTFSEDHEQSWIHEGSADMMAALALLSLEPDANNFVAKKLDVSKRNCVNYLQTNPLDVVFLA